MFIIFMCNDIARISPVTGIEERKAQILYPTIRKGFELHTEIPDFRIGRFNHYGTLLGNDVTKPATMVVGKFSVDETDSPTTTAPRCLDHQTRRMLQALLYRLGGCGLDGRFPVQQTQHLCGMTTVGKVADGGYLRF